jgi:hypothetical protein
MLDMDAHGYIPSKADFKYIQENKNEISSTDKTKENTTNDEIKKGNEVYEKDYSSKGSGQHNSKYHTSTEANNQEQDKTEINRNNVYDRGVNPFTYNQDNPINLREKEIRDQLKSPDRDNIAKSEPQIKALISHEKAVTAEAKENVNPKSQEKFVKDTMNMLITKAAQGQKISHIKIADKQKESVAER